LQVGCGGGASGGRRQAAVSQASSESLADAAAVHDV